MEYLILGLLMLSPMTGYDLQQFIKKNLALICSHSAGSVQTALAKLEKEGKVTTCESAQGKRRKKIFSITDTGRTAFSSWVAQPMQADIPDSVRSRILGSSALERSTLFLSM